MPCSWQREQIPHGREKDQYLVAYEKDENLVAIKKVKHLAADEKYKQDEQVVAKEYVRGELGSKDDVGPRTSIYPR